MLFQIVSNYRSIVFKTVLYNVVVTCRDGDKDTVFYENGENGEDKQYKRHVFPLHTITKINNFMFKNF